MEGGLGGHGAVVDRGEGEEEEARVDLPECATGDEAFGPAFRGAGVGFRAYAGVFGCY